MLTDKELRDKLDIILDSFEGGFYKPKLRPKLLKLIKQETDRARIDELNYWIKLFPMSITKYNQVNGKAEKNPSMVLTPSKVEYYIPLDELQDRIKSLKGGK